jgi:hypothetical protein
MTLMKLRRRIASPRLGTSSIRLSVRRLQQGLAGDKMALVALLALQQWAQELPLPPPEK